MLKNTKFAERYTKNEKKVNSQFRQFVDVSNSGVIIFHFVMCLHQIALNLSS